MSRMGVLAVCILLVLAGCGGAPGDDGGAATETTTDATVQSETTEDDATDASETNDETTTDATESDDANARDDLPPGLSTDGVTDAEALAAAHEEWLAGQTYTYDREVRVVARNGTELGGWSQHVQVGADRLEFNHTQTGEGVSVSGLAIEDTRAYTNGSVTFREADDFRDGYRRTPGRGFAATTFSSEQLLADVLNASETSVTEMEPGDGSGGDADDGTWYRVRAENGSETLTYRGPNGTVEVEATNVTATAVVAPSGFVRNVTYEFDFVRGNVSGHRTMTIRYSSVGETTVEVPAWVEDAKAATNATTEG